VLDRCVAAAVVDNEAKDLTEFMRRVRRLARDKGIVDVRAALSDGGGFADLAALYGETRDAIRYAYAFESETDVNGVSEASGSYIDASAPRRCRPVLQAMKYVREHLDDPTLSLTRLASDILFMNPDYFGKLFKREVGVKFSDFILSMRMEKARQLINSSADVKVYEVARQIGLGENTAYFSQLFKKYTGMLPSEYGARNATRSRREREGKA
jgi:AraC-like DNA-binding protein